MREASSRITLPAEGTVVAQLAACIQRLGQLVNEVTSSQTDHSHWAELRRTISKLKTLCSNETLKRAS